MRRRSNVASGKPSFWRRVVYWCVVGNTVKCVIDADHEEDLFRYAMGNYFRTEADAEIALRDGRFATTGGPV